MPGPKNQQTVWVKKTSFARWATLKRQVQAKQDRDLSIGQFLEMAVDAWEKAGFK